MIVEALAYAMTSFALAYGMYMIVMKLHKRESVAGGQVIQK